MAQPPSSSRERVAPAAQPLPGEKKPPTVTAQRLLGEEKSIFHRSKTFSRRSAGCCKRHDLVSTRRRGRASGTTRFPSRERVAPAAHPVFRVENAMRGLEMMLFLPGKQARQSGIANLDTENEISRSQNPAPVPRRRLAATAYRFSTRKWRFPAGNSASRHEEGDGRLARQDPDSKQRRVIWRNGLFRRKTSQVRRDDRFCAAGA